MALGIRAFPVLGCATCSSYRSRSTSFVRHASATRSFFSTLGSRAADGPLPAADPLTSAFTMNRRPVNNFSAYDMLGDRSGIDYKPGEASLTSEPEPYHLHILSSRHNTHITLTRPNRDAIMSVTAGSIGFRKASRGTYDAGFQLAAFVLSSIQERGLLLEIKELELIFSGFGEGREAVRKAVMGSEGTNIRKRIVRVTDATTLKFGGTRGKKPRRLG